MCKEYIVEENYCVYSEYILRLGFFCSDLPMFLLLMPTQDVCAHLMFSEFVDRWF